jgi:RNA polymerase sigma-70 factor, ECF subfamily
MMRVSRQTGITVDGVPEVHPVHVEPTDASARLEEAYHAWGADLWRAIFAFAGGRRDVADEAVAEAFAQSGRALERIERLRPWLYRAAFRIAAGELQRSGRDRALDRRDEQIAADDAQLLGPELASLLLRLSPNQRGVIVMRDLYGETTAEAAGSLGISEVAVRVHLHAARRRLREAIEEAER